MEKIYKVIIIGSGPAGLTAGIYAGRSGLEPLIVGGENYGGQLMQTTEVENYPGFAQGIMGPELMKEMLKQAERFGAKIIYKSATKVDFSQRPFKIEVYDEIYFAESVIIATGAKPLWLNLKNEKELTGRGVSTCATCDAAFYKNREVVVVGGGDTAMEEALYLTKFAKLVTIIHRRDNFRASKVMQDKIFTNEKIKIIWNSELTEYLFTGEVSGEIKTAELTGVKIQNKLTNDISELKTDGVFIAIGHEPLTHIFESIDKDEKGYIKPIDGKVKTNIEGVLVCGDAEDHIYRQAIVAAGSGCMAAIEAEKFLTK